MKLKKIASLALAGVMAVSMLTACGGKTVNDGENNNGSVVVPTSSIVTAVNNGQDATNKVKIEFTSDASLDAALTKAVDAIGEYPATFGLNWQMKRLTGMECGFGDMLGNKDSVHETLITMDGNKMERFEAFPLMSKFADKAAAEKAAAKFIDEEIVSKLDDTTLTGKTLYNTKYADLAYTGSVSMVSATANDGTVNYYVAVVITRTVNVKTLKPAEA